MAVPFASAQADAVISFDVLNATLVAGSGDTVTFVGTVTNDSLQDLNASYS
jgi:hypothetical protein